MAIETEPINYKNIPLTMALNKDNVLVEIDSVPNGKNCGCRCPYCKTSLIARNGGNIREHHFAHENDADCGHAVESALHKLAKEVIEKEKSVCLPSYYKEGFPTGFVTLHDVKVEEYDNQLKIIPDVEGLLYTGERLLIEILNTHEVDDKKRDIIISNNLKCIEIDVKSVPLDRTKMTEYLCHSSENRYWIGDGYSYIFSREKIKNPQGYIFNLAAQKIKDRFDNQANPFVLIINGKTECPYKNVCLSKNELSFAIGCFSKGYSKEWNLHDDYNSCTKSANGLVLTNSKHSEKEPIFIEFCTKQMVQKCKEDNSTKKIIVHLSENIEEAEHQIEGLCKLNPIEVGCYDFGFSIYVQNISAPINYDYKEIVPIQVYRADFLKNRELIIRRVRCYERLDNKTYDDQAIYEFILYSKSTDQYLNEQNAYRIAYNHLIELEFKPLRSCLLCINNRNNYGLFGCSKGYEVKDEFGADSCMDFNVGTNLRNDYNQVFKEIYKQEGEIEYEHYYIDTPKINHSIEIKSSEIMSSKTFLKNRRNKTVRTNKQKNDGGDQSQLEINW